MKTLLKPTNEKLNGGLIPSTYHKTDLKEDRGNDCALRGNQIPFFTRLNRHDTVLIDAFPAVRFINCSGLVGSDLFSPHVKMGLDKK